VVPEHTVKSIGHEETFAVDHRDPDVLHVEVVRQADAVANRMRKAGVAGRTVTLKIRFHDFRTITRSRTAPAPMETGIDLARVAGELLAAVDCSEGVRLLGLSASNLVGRQAEQLSFDDPPDTRAGDQAENGHRDGPGPAPVAQAIDDVRRRFGDDAVGPAALIRGGKLKLKRPGDQQWGPSAVPKE
jgi:DNA polymerase-4